MRPAILSVLMLFAAAPARAAGAEQPTFETHIRPILKASCFPCHGEAGKPKAKLDLRLRRLIAKGGRSGPALAPGDPNRSLLYQRIRRGEMPPGDKKLTASDIDLVGRWIAAGAPVRRPEPEHVRPGFQITAEEQAFWSFQPIRRPAVPAFDGPARARNPIDAFLLARLGRDGASFSPEADRRTLLRRACFDLTGLPPTSEEADRFLHDPSSDAYERLIDRLLASPRYGERWGRHWLDVAGYADSEGFTADPVRPHAYKYRDYVIRAFNEDRPFDQFITEQLAGDELVRPPYRDLAPADVEKLAATGFLRTAADGTASADVDAAAARHQVLVDTIRIVSTSLLGLSVGCAQCHDHRYDPIPQTDFYRLRAVLEPAYDTRHWRTPAERRVSLYRDADRRRAAQIEADASRVEAERAKKVQEFVARTFEAELKKLPDAVRGPVRQASQTPEAKRTAEQKRLLRDYPSVNVTDGSLYLYDPKAAEELKKYTDRAAAVRAAKPVEDFVRALTEIPGVVPATRLFYRGDPAQPRQAVEPGGLAVLDSWLPCPTPAPGSLPTTGRRLAYARWLTGGRHPLTARVLVNRVWMHHMGRGLVGTPADFGALGERPTHPELLDWMADEFMAGGWRLKRLHRLIMTSAAYRQSSERRPAPDARDPGNRLCGRMSVRRLEAEAVRDATLAVAGRLNLKMYGPPVPVRENEVGQVEIGVDNKDADGRPGPEVPLHGDEFRRSVYVQVRRSRVLGVLEVFDAPGTEPNCPARNASTVAPQALLLMNSDFALAQARAFAERIRREAADDPRAQAARAFQLAFTREPSAAETNEAAAFLTEQAARFTGPDARLLALASLCQALLGSNEFLYID